MTITRWDAFPIGSSATTAYWKSRPRYRTLRSNTGFPERSMNASGLNCKVSSTFPSAAGSISSVGMTCCQRLSCGLSPMRSSSTPSTASCRSSTSLSNASWKRSAPRMRCRSHTGDWRCRRRYEQVWRSSRNGEAEFSLLRISRMRSLQKADLSGSERYPVCAGDLAMTRRCRAGAARSDNKPEGRDARRDSDHT